jgi:5-methylthioribose kinase
MPSDLIATTPRVFHLDEGAGVTIMEDCGPGTTTLKQLILDHQLSNLTPSLNESFLAQAGRIGVELGRFAGVLHGWGLKDEDRSAIEMFSKHQEGRTITGWATYGRLISTLTGVDGLPMLKDPPFEVSQDKLDVLAKIAEERQRQIMEANETMTHGDFWPGNILVNMQREGDKFVLKRIFIVDWELVKPGIKGTDLGQFCAELHLLRQFHKGTTDAVNTILQTFLETYNQFHKVDIALSRVANAHMGAHLVGWLPRVPWGEKDRVREVVAEGVEDLVQAYSGPDDWLAHSVIPPM